MIHIPKLSTRRLAVQLKEISIGDSIKLASMPGHLEQARITAFLQSAIQTVERGEANPLVWTVQERTLGVTNYLASILPDGPDFALGDTRYSDYLNAAVDYASPIAALGEACGDTWDIRHLTGHAAETIEGLASEFAWPGRQFWPIGMMAAQLTRAGEDAPALFTDRWLLDRIQVFSAFPESDFLLLLDLFMAGRDKLKHLFDVQYDDQGLVNVTQGGRTSASARFPVSAGLSAFAKMD